jgi:hypothetical protein
MSRCSEDFTNSEAMNHKRHVMLGAPKFTSRYVCRWPSLCLPLGRVGTKHACGSAAWCAMGSLRAFIAQQ